MNHLRTRAPCLGCALAALAGALFTGQLWWSLGLFLGAIVVSRRGAGWWAALLFVAVLAMLRDEGLKSEIREVWNWTSDGARDQMVSGRLVVGPSWKPGKLERVAVLHTESGEVRVLLGENRFSKAGEVYKVTGVLARPEEVMRNPGRKSSVEYLDVNYLAGELRIHEAVLMGEEYKYGIYRFSETLRDMLREKITAGIESGSEEEKIVLAMVMGQTPARDSEVTMAFRESGTLHVFAVSGLHVNVVGVLIWGVLMVCRLSRRQAIVGIVLGMLVYTLLTGARPPAVRATVMASIFLGAFWVRRRPSLLNALSVSLILVVLVSPAQVRTIGFQMSYGVLMSIAVGYRFFYDRTARLTWEDPFMPRALLGKWSKGCLWVRRYLSAGLATSIPAWLGSLPLLAWHFGVVVPASMLASVFLIPLTFAVLALAMASFLLGSVSESVGVAINQVNRGMAKTSFGLADVFSSIPGGYVEVPRLVPADMVIFDTGDGGAASFVNSGEGLLIDAGSEDAYYDIVDPALNKWGVDPGWLALSHPDIRHVGGGLELVENGQGVDVLLPVQKARSPSYGQILTSAEDSEQRLVVEGEEYQIDEDTVLEVIQAGSVQDLKADDRGAIYRLHRNGWRVLMMGDAGFETEKILEGKGVSCDLIVMGRHKEHGYSGTSSFLRHTGAKAVVISGGSFPKTEEVPELWRNMVEKMGIELFWQKETGAVLIDFSEEEMRLKSYLIPKREVILKKSEVSDLQANSVK